MADLKPDIFGSPPPLSGVASNEGDGGLRHFYTGPVIKTELLIDWLERHGIPAISQWVNPDLPDDGDLSRETSVRVSTVDYHRAQQLFFAEREDEL